MAHCSAYLSIVSFVLLLQGFVQADFEMEDEFFPDFEGPTGNFRAKRAIKQSGRILSSTKGRGRTAESMVDVPDSLGSADPDLAEVKDPSSEEMDDPPKSEASNTVAEERNYIPDDQPLAPMPRIRDTSIQIPRYNAKTMAPSTFLTDAEDYLTLQGVPKSKWHILAVHFFYEGSDQEQWYYAHRAGLRSWKAFKTAFVVYETAEMNLDLLTQELYLTKQGRKEGFESFAWRMYTLYKRVSPKAKDKDIVDRILHACHQEIADALWPMGPTSVYDLVMKAKKVLGNRNKNRRNGYSSGYRH